MTAYEMRSSDWCSDLCFSDLREPPLAKVQSARDRMVPESARRREALGAARYVALAADRGAHLRSSPGEKRRVRQRRLDDSQPARKELVRAQHCAWPLGPFADSQQP